MTHEAREPLERFFQRRHSEIQAWRERELKMKAQLPMRPEPTPDDYATAEDYWQAFAAWQAELRARLAPYPNPMLHRDLVLETVVDADGHIIYRPDLDGRSP